MHILNVVVYNIVLKLITFLYSTGMSCKIPSISLGSLSRNPESTQKIQRSSSYTVKVNVSSQTQGKAHITWKIAKLRNSNKRKVGRKSTFKSTRIAMEDVYLINTTAIQKEILNHTLQYGVYYVEVMVVMKNAADCMNYNYGFLRIEESPLQAFISTDPPLDSILKGYHRNLQLDASSSFDPDVKKDNKSGMSFTWLCARKGESFGNIALLPIVTPHVHSKESDGKGCYGNGPGKLNYTGPNAVLFLDQMEPESYVIKLILRKDEREENVSFDFELNPSNGFVLEIR